MSKLRVSGTSSCSTASRSATPNVTRCGDPGTSAVVSVNVRSCGCAGPELDDPTVVVGAAALEPPPHAATAAALAPAARKVRRLIGREACGCDIQPNLSSLDGRRR